MKRTPQQGGFTVVETLIVLAVSGMLFLGAILLVAGQQRKVEFSQAINDAQSVVNQVISEVSSGYYPNAGNIVCTVSGSPPAQTMNITTPSKGTPQGSNDGCIFLGKAIQFGNDGDTSAYVIHSLAGLADNDGTLAGVKPRTINVSNSRVVDSLHNGLTVSAMRYVSDVGTANISGLAFVNGLGTVGADNQVQSGSQQLALVPVIGSGPVTATNITTTKSAIDSQMKTEDAIMNPATPPNPTSNTSVQVCLHGSGDQYAQLTIGGSGRSLSVQLDVKSAECW